MTVLGSFLYSSALRRSGALGVSGVVLMVALSGCALNKVNEGKNVTFDGHRFNAKLAEAKDNRASFVVVVAEVSKSLSGAREAGRYEATKHCLREYGTSEVTWRLGPDAPDGQLRISDNTLTLVGECVGW